jgi:integrase
VRQDLRQPLRALRVADIDLDAAVIHVRRGWDAVEGEQEGKSAAANRRVPILAPLAPILKAHLERTKRIGDALVFGRTLTEPFVPSTARTRALAAWKRENERRVENANGDEVELLSPIGLHECRHTLASMLIAANCNVKVLSTILATRPCR